MGFNLDEAFLSNTEHDARNHTTIPGAVTVEDEGSTQGLQATLDFVGDGVVAAGGTITIAGGGGATGFAFLQSGDTQAALTAALADVAIHTVVVAAAANISITTPVSLNAKRIMGAGGGGKQTGQISASGGHFACSSSGVFQLTSGAGLSGLKMQFTGNTGGPFITGFNSGCYVEKCWIECTNAAMSSFMVQMSTASLIADSYLLANGSCPAKGVNMISGGRGSVRGVTVYMTTLGGVGQHGISASFDADVSDCTVVNAGGNGYQIQGGGMSVRGCISTGARQNGFNLTGGGLFTVMGCVATGSLLWGFNGPLGGAQGGATIGNKASSNTSGNYNLGSFWFQNGNLN